MSAAHWAGHVLWILFGPGTWGSGGNIVAWVICGAMGFGWLHAKEKARHLQRLTQATRHHQEAMALAAQHHQDLKDHVTALAADAQVSGGAGSNPAGAGLPADQRVVPPPAARTSQVAVPQQVLDAIKNAKPPGGDRS